MPPQPQRDEEMAQKYGISVEFLREGMPRRLQGAPDGQILFGDRLCVRVANAKQLEDAIELTSSSYTSTGPPPPALDCYIVAYLPPREAPELRDLWEKRVEGVPNIAVQNMDVLEAKERAFERIAQKIVAVEGLINMLKKLAARLLHHENLASNVEHLFSLKIRYLLCKIRSGDTDTAKSLLKDMPEIEGDAADFGPARMLEVANELSELYLPDPNPVAENEVSDEIGRLILAEISSSDWRDRMQIIDDDPRLLECIEETVVELQRRVTLYTEITTEASLIGAAYDAFGEL